MQAGRAQRISSPNPILKSNFLGPGPQQSASDIRSQPSFHPEYFSTLRTIKTVGFDNRSKLALPERQTRIIQPAVAYFNAFRDLNGFQV